MYVTSFWTCRDSSSLNSQHLNEYISETDISDVEEDDDQAVQMKKKRVRLCNGGKTGINEALGVAL